MFAVSWQVSYEVGGAGAADEYAHSFKGVDDVVLFLRRILRLCPVASSFLSPYPQG